VTGYIVAQPKPIPEAKRAIGTFGDIDDIQNNHSTGDPREAAKQAKDPEDAYYETDRYPYTSWKGSNNSEDKAPTEKKPDELMDYLTKL
jgi:hypothetical protein